MNNHSLLSMLKFWKYVLYGRVRFPKSYLCRNTHSRTMQSYVIFRHARLNAKRSGENCILLVRFKFMRFSTCINKMLSLIPIPMIVGTDGFLDKIWMVDHDTGYWQGLYQWEDLESLMRYKESFVFGLMNKRAIPETLSVRVIENSCIDDFVHEHSEKSGF